MHANVLVQQLARSKLWQTRLLMEGPRAKSSESLAAETALGNHKLIDVRVFRLIRGLALRLWVPTAIVLFLSTPSPFTSPPVLPSSIHPSKIFEQTRYIPRQIGGTSAVGRLSGFKQYPLRKLARWRTNQLLIKPLSFRDGRHGDRGGGASVCTLVHRHKRNRITLES